VETQAKRPLDVLLVEDNAADVVLALAALRDAGFGRVQIAADADRALALLRSSRRFDLVLLDLKLPGRSGLELLVEVKNDPVLASQVVMILTGSDDELDVERAYRDRANAYLVKPVGSRALADVMRAIGDFWGRAKRPVLTPHRPRGPVRP
jgi:CheY-like chemotaxis protein